jgi:hypothetical protein
MRWLLAWLLVVAVPTPASSQSPVDRAAEVVAQALAEGIVARDAGAVAVLCALPVNIDGEVVTSVDELERRWLTVLERPEVRGLRLLEVEVVRMVTAVERYGPPPVRLGELPVEDALVAILRFDRAQVTAVLARREGRWAIVAVTD